MLKLVKQKHVNGCVPACIATLLGTSYEIGLKIVHPRRKTRRWNYVGTTYQSMVIALERLGLKCYKKKITSLSKLRYHCILIIAHPAYGPPEECRHAVVWDAERKKVLDPYPSNKRAMSRQLPISSYEKSVVYVVEIK
jgi:ABC-type bacteriocin/lantibiotic exporter with double-glycine peptidase domain